MPADKHAPRPRVIVLGNQKSGTTAVACLLAEMCGMSTFIDLPMRLRRAGYALVRGKRDLHGFVESHPECLDAELVKVPTFTFVARELAQLCPESRYVLVVRDPRDNIRSLLNRRKLRGDRRQLAWPQRLWFWLGRRPTFDPRLWGGRDENYIGVLAHRWNRAVSAVDELTQVEVIRYEDFMADKLGALTQLANNLGLDVESDISARLDVRYQPAGDHQVSWLDFFGEENLGTIERICHQQMHRFGYK